MSFFYKKLISALLMPLPLSLFLIFLGLLGIWFCRRKRLAGFFVTLGFFSLIACSTNTVPNKLLLNLESQYPPLTRVPANVNTIVVLGGGVRGNTSAPANTQLGSSSLSRLVEGIRLYQLLKQKGAQPKLILSGGRVFGSPDAAGKMQYTAVILGVKRKDITVENGTKDTRHEALYLKKQLEQKPFILVTSANHMPRAMLVFKKYGMHPIAAPTQFLSKQNRYTIYKYWIPSSANLVRTDLALHEYIGIWWEKMLLEND